jgi:hypothetical protein
MRRNDMVDRKSTITRQAGALGRLAVGSVAVGAFAAGALAVGALAVGALAIGRLTIGRAEFKSLKVGRLEVDEVVWGSQSTPAEAALAGAEESPAAAEEPAMSERTAAP